MRGLLRSLAIAALFLCARAFAAEFVQAVEFPYYLYPPQLWERELVWLKTIGVRTVAFSIPWNWHTVEGGADFTGRTSPRRDLAGFVRTLRRLHLRAWIRPAGPVRGWHGGDHRPSRAFLRELERLLATQTEPHGGPIAFVEGAPGYLGLPAPPAPVAAVAANAADALLRSRSAMGGARGSLLWQEVEDAVYPVGWEQPGGPIFRTGAVSLSGNEQPGVAALRRNAALLREWAALLPSMEPLAKPPAQPASGKFPEGVTAAQLVSPAASAVNVVNRSGAAWRGELKVWYAAAKHIIALPEVEVPAGGAVWLPVNVSLAGGVLCRDCSGLAGAEHIVYATAELQSLEFENGILAMEFSAEAPGEVVLQLSRQPVGPYLAAGRPAQFDFDEKTLRARLPVPAGTGATHRVRIGLAIEPPETSAFFVEAHRLVIGRGNTISTSYSSPELAARSRLRLPEGWTAKPVEKSPTEIDYEIDVPSDAAHGDWANLAIEADGVLLGRARLQLFRPASITFGGAVKMHYGKAELPVEPPLIPIDPKQARNEDIGIRNNTPQIQNYRVESSGAGLEFSPARTEVAIGAVMDRKAEVRVFDAGGAAGIRPWRLRISGGADVDMPVRFVAIPRGQTVAYSADLDGDGYPEWILESQRARAVFSAQDGGRWLEFVWKENGANVLADNGALAGAGPVDVRMEDSALKFSAKGWQRTARLNEGVLTIEQTAPLGAGLPSPGRINEVAVEVRHEPETRAVIQLSR